MDTYNSLAYFPDNPMPRHPLTAELLRIVAKPDAWDTEFEDWSARCQSELARMPTEEAHALLRELQSVVNENRTLFEQENRHILEELGDTGRQDKTALTRKYRDISRL